MPRTSYLLNFCAAITVICSLQVFTFWTWTDLKSTGWGIAWCDSSSDALRWVLLFTWATTGIIVVLNWIKGRVATAYNWTIASYTLFWGIVFALPSKSDNNDTSGVMVLLLFFGLMNWSLYRYKKRRDTFSLGIPRLKGQQLN